MEEPTHLVVGHVSKPHGTRGEVLVSPLTDHPDAVFMPGAELRAAADDGETPDPDFPPLRVESVRAFHKGLLVGFSGVETRNDAERLRDLYLVTALEELPPLEEGELFYHQLLGMRVFTVDGRDLGGVREVYELHPAHMLEVRGQGKTVLIPFTSEIVREIDPERKRLVVEPPEGLLDL